MKNQNSFKLAILGLIAFSGLLYFSCSNQQMATQNKGALAGDVASQVYVAPGEYDEFYAFMSGGYSGQVSVQGLPSGRLLKVIPVFSVDPEKVMALMKKPNQC